MNFSGIDIWHILFVTLFCLTDYFLWFFYAGLVAYIAQLIIYTRIFMLAYRRTVKEVEDYYDDDAEHRLVQILCSPVCRFLYTY